jgi:putative oxidoreductase
MTDTPPPAAAPPAAQTDAASGFARHAHWALRIALASVFIYHGLDKFIGGAGPAGFAAAMGLPAIVGFLVALGEIGAGAFVILGGFMRNAMGELVTRLGALGAIVILLGAIFMVHMGQWNFMPTATHPMGGMEFQATLMFIAVYLLSKGNAR